jgi:hypothetical protein
MTIRGVNFQPALGGQFSGGVDTDPVRRGERAGARLWISAEDVRIPAARQPRSRRGRAVPAERAAARTQPWARPRHVRAAHHRTSTRVITANVPPVAPLLATATCTAPRARRTGAPENRPHRQPLQRTPHDGFQRHGAYESIRHPAGRLMWWKAQHRPGERTVDSRLTESASPGQRTRNIQLGRPLRPRSGLEHASCRCPDGPRPARPARPAGNSGGQRGRRLGRPDGLAWSATKVPGRVRTTPPRWQR